MDYTGKERQGSWKARMLGSKEGFQAFLRPGLPAEYKGA